MSCPNGDPSFNTILRNLVGSATPETRRAVYYGICIWVRAILYGLVWLYRSSTWIPWVLLVFGGLSILQLWKSVWNAGTQWWSKRFQLAIAIALVIASIGRIQYSVDTRILPAILWTSLLGGLVQSVWTRWC